MILRCTKQEAASHTGMVYIVHESGKHQLGARVRSTECDELFACGSVKKKRKAIETELTANCDSMLRHCARPRGALHMLKTLRPTVAPWR